MTLLYLYWEPFNAERFTLDRLRVGIVPLPVLRRAAVFGSDGEQDEPGKHP